MYLKLLCTWNNPNYYTGAMSETGTWSPESQNLFYTALL